MKKTIIFCLFLGMDTRAQIDINSFLFLSEDVKKEVIPLVQQLINSSKASEKVLNQTISEQKTQLTAVTFERDKYLSECNRLSAESNIYRDKLSVANQQLKQFEGAWGKVKGPIKITISVLVIFGTGYTIYYLYFKPAPAKDPETITEEEFRQKIIRNEIARTAALLETQKLALENAKKIQEELKKKGSKAQIEEEANAEIARKQTKISINAKAQG